MKNISNILKINFTPKIKSFLISDGKSKILLARQFTEMTRIQLQSLNSAFIRCLLSSTSPSGLKNEEKKTLFTTNTNQFITYRLNINRTSSSKDMLDNAFFFVLVTSVNFNIIEGQKLLKLITRFILETINHKYETQDSPLSFIDIVKSKAFDIILGIDDIINPIMGSEGISSTTRLLSNLKMESVEEKVFIKEKNVKITKAHDDLLKGMEEIDRMKYERRYENTNAISSDDISKRELETELREDQFMLEEIAKEKMKEQQRREMRSNMGGMDLRRHFMERIGAVTFNERESMGSFVNVCENLIQQMMLKEMKRMNNPSNDDDDDDDTYTQSAILLSTGGQIIISPMQYFYSSNCEEDDDE